MNFNKINITDIIQKEVNRISQKYNKDFLDCEDIIKITGLGRDNVRNLLRSKNFPTTIDCVFIGMSLKTKNSKWFINKKRG